MSSGKRTLWGVLIVLAAFGAGYLTSWVPARQSIRELEDSVAAAEARNQETQRALEGAELEADLAGRLGQLGEVYVDINANNFGVASEKITPFFDGLSALLDSDPALTESQLEALRGILSRRDEIVADLAQANPEVRQKVGQMFARLQAQLAP